MLCRTLCVRYASRPASLCAKESFCVAFEAWCPKLHPLSYKTQLVGISHATSTVPRSLRQLEHISCPRVRFSTERRRQKDRAVAGSNLGRLKPATAHYQYVSFFHYCWPILSLDPPLLNAARLGLLHDLGNISVRGTLGGVCARKWLDSDLICSGLPTGRIYISNEGINGQAIIPVQQKSAFERVIRSALSTCMI